MGGRVVSGSGGGGGTTGAELPPLSRAPPPPPFSRPGSRVRHAGRPQCVRAVTPARPTVSARGRTGARPPERAGEPPGSSPAVRRETPPQATPGPPPGPPRGSTAPPRSRVPVLHPLRERSGARGCSESGGVPVTSAGSRGAAREAAVPVCGREPETARSRARTPAPCPRVLCRRHRGSAKRAPSAGGSACAAEDGGGGRRRPSADARVPRVPRARRFWLRAKIPPHHRLCRSNQAGVLWGPRETQNSSPEAVEAPTTR